MNYARLLEQHDHYDLNDVVSVSRRKSRPWFVYVGGQEIEFALNGIQASLREFASAEQAIQWCESPNGREAVRRAQEKIERDFKRAIANAKSQSTGGARA